MQVYWGNDLGALADKLLANLSRETVASPADLLAQEHCIVLPNRSLQSWLQQHLLLDAPSGPLRTLANVRYPMLYQFVNDWLFWMKHPGEQRDASAHPFSVRALQWRLYALLRDASMLARPSLAPLQRFVHAAGTIPQARQRRTYHLAGTLARLFDDYQVYRPDLLYAWQKGQDGERSASTPWQADVWRTLTRGADRKETYLQAFLEMPQQLPSCKIRAQHPAIHVFGISMMPQAYLACFQILSSILPVYLYLFNPCRQQWDDLLSPARTERLRQELQLQGREDDADLLQCGNDLLANTGRGCRNFLAQVLDATQGQIEDLFQPPANEDALLGRLQASILDNRPAPEPDPNPNQNGEPFAGLPAGCDTIHIHSCHSPMREMEVLRDTIYRWFADDTSLQPRHIQVLVSDMETYAPYIDAVLGEQNPYADDAIPYAVADRRNSGENVLAQACSQILQLPDSRFTAPEVIGLLQVESIRTRFGLSESDITTATRIIADSGIRWGLDPAHRKQRSGASFGEQTTWEHGLDRLLIGYAMTSKFEAAGIPLPCDTVEDASSDLLGRVIRFVDELQTTAEEAQIPRAPNDWSEWLKRVIDRFFARTEDTYADVEPLYRAADELATTSAAASFQEAISIEVVRDSLSEQALSSSQAPGASLQGNKVVFSALRLGAAAPRRIIALLGLGDGRFPRSSNRPAYDLLRNGSRFGDPSLRTEDRAAFLEAFWAAREHLHISYVGQGIRENEPIPPSTVVRELIEVAETVCPGTSLRTTRHKLHPFHPAYFSPQAELPGLFSYDRENLEAARAVLHPGEPTHPQPTPTRRTEAPISLLELNVLLHFFQNPARFFFTRILKTRLQDRDTVQLTQEEEFTPGGFVAWQIHTAIIQGLCRGHAPTPIYRQLCERGLAPLGSWGQDWFQERWSDIETRLQRPLGDGLQPVITYLQTQQPLADAPLETIIGSIRLRGMADGIRDTDGSVVALDYRYASPRERDALTSWIRHLFVCAADGLETRISLQEKQGTGKTTSQYWFEPLTQSQAHEHLATLMACYREGLDRCLPFTTETSHAFAQATLAATASAGQPPNSRRKTAPKSPLRAARAKWYSNRFSYHDDRDPYHQAAFGPDGPFQDPAFARFAQMVFEPMLQAHSAQGGTA